ncbi:MAG: hypothetical protein ACJ74W_03035 [Pyrinomonadaceae bacterium]
MTMRGELRGLIPVVLVIVIVVVSMRPRPATVYVGEAVDASPLQGVVLGGFDDNEEERIRAALLRKLTLPCQEAFEGAGLRSPARMFSQPGIIIQHYIYLHIYSAGELGLVSEATRAKYWDEFGTGRAQAGTIPHARYGRVMTVDGRARIYLHDTAFLGDSFLSVFYGWLSLDDVLTHELIHAAGQVPTPGIFGPLQHDLAGYEHYNKIIEACR